MIWSVHQALQFQTIADRPDTAVHHVAQHDFRARFGMRQRLTHQNVFGRRYPLALLIDHPVLTVGGVKRSSAASVRMPTPGTASFSARTVRCTSPSGL